MIFYLDFNLFKTIYGRPRIKDEYLEILVLHENQVDDKIAWGLDEGFLSFNLSFVC